MYGDQGGVHAQADGSQVEVVDEDGEAVVDALVAEAEAEEAGGDGLEAASGQKAGSALLAEPKGQLQLKIGRFQRLLRAAVAAVNI